MFSISLENVSVVFPATKARFSLFTNRAGGMVALSNISFKVKSGDRIGIVGKNGAGKSTLLRAIAGIYHPNHGKIETVGNVSSMFNMGLGMQQEYTGFRNIHISNLISGIPPNEREKITSEIADFSELGNFLNEPVRTYSSGMSMRLKFACATAKKPEILLLDEWIGAGDQEFQKKATERMHELVENSGILLLATHNIPLMKKMCNKAIWLDKGNLLKYGDIEDVLAMRAKSIKGNI